MGSVVVGRRRPFRQSRCSSSCRIDSHLPLLVQGGEASAVDSTQQQLQQQLQPEQQAQSSRVPVLGAGGPLASGRPLEG